MRRQIEVTAAFSAHQPAGPADGYFGAQATEPATTSAQHEDALGYSPDLPDSPDSSPYSPDSSPYLPDSPPYSPDSDLGMEDCDCMLH
jgi:hypothetical protein